MLDPTGIGFDVGRLTLLPRRTEPRTRPRCRVLRQQRRRAVRPAQDDAFPA